MRKVLLIALSVFALCCFAACGGETEQTPQVNEGGNGGSSIELPEDKFN